MTPEQLQQDAIDAIAKNQNMVLKKRPGQKALPGFPKGKLISEETGYNVYQYDPIKILAWMKRNYLIRHIFNNKWDAASKTTGG